MNTNMYDNKRKRIDLLKESKELTKEFNYLKSLFKRIFSERKEMEKNIIRSEAKYRFMFDRNPQPNWIYDHETLSFLEVNEAAIRHYGYSRQEFLSMTLKDIYPAEDIQNLLKYDSQVFVNKYEMACECRHVRKNGECIFVEVVASQLPLNNKNMVYATIHDITNRKRMVNKLFESETNFRRSIYDSPVGIRIVAIDGKTIYANKALLDIYELNSLKEFLSISTKDWYTPESYEQHQKRKELRKRGQDVFEYEISFKRKNGEVRHIKVSKKEVLWDGVKHFQVISQNITEQRNAEERLLLFSKVVEQAPNAICITNTDGIIEYANSRTFELTGFTKDELIGVHTRIFSSGLNSKQVYAELWKTVKSGDVWSGELYNKKQNGEFYWEFLKVSPIFNHKNEITHFLSINSDVTQQKRMFRDLVLAKESTEKSEIFLRTFIENIPFDIWACDVNYVGILENRMHVDHFGTIIGNVLKKDSAITQKNDWVWENTIKRVLKGEVIDEECEFEINHQLNIFQQIAFPIYKKEKVIGVAGLNINMTARKLAETALMKSEEQLRKFASHLQDVREAERSALAREIHDDLGQILVALKIDTGLLKQKILKDNSINYSKEISLKFDSLANLINDTIKTVRRIMNGLRPEQLELLGLKSAINEYIRDFEDRYKLNCELKYSIEEFDIDQRQTLALFRIMQEAMTNISKYAKATAVIIELTYSNDKLVMEIADNGIGFDPKHSGRDDSYGMIGMRERVSLLNGKLLITTKIGQGTTVRVEIPY